jgi:AcrR family transcriptional regulator
MGHPLGKKEESRARILAGAARAFRSFGFGGSGVDGLAKASGVTSGAFYGHFSSKADAFREVVVSGMRDLETAIRSLRDEAGARWIDRFIEFYLGEKRTCALGDSCALQSLTGEVERSSAETREAYEAELRAVIEATAEGVDAPTREARRKQAITLLVLLAGGVTLARAVRDPALAAEIASAVRGAAQGTRARVRPAHPKLPGA